MFPTILSAQTDFVSIGFTNANTNGEVSVSVGQLSVQYDSNAAGDVQQGVQQTYIVGLDNVAEDNDLDIWIFPNPTTTRVKIHVSTETFNKGDLTYNIYDAAGRLVAFNSILSEETEIPMEFYAQGNYLLKIQLQETIMGAYKIIRL